MVNALYVKQSKSKDLIQMGSVNAEDLEMEKIFIIQRRFCSMFTVRVDSARPRKFVGCNNGLVYQKLGM